jgi:hypothetical protein
MTLGKVRIAFLMTKRGGIQSVILRSHRRHLTLTVSYVQLGIIQWLRQLKSKYLVILVHRQIMKFDSASRPLQYTMLEYLLHDFLLIDEGDFVARTVSILFGQVPEIL